MQTAQIARQKYDIISWVTRLEDRKLINRLHREATKEKGEIIRLSPTQLEMIKMSEDDIKNGRIVSEEELNKRDAQWLH
jgi:DNA-binding MarR family transcriptional regulator